jgi:hypothetical protein
MIESNVVTYQQPLPTKHSPSPFKITTRPLSLPLHPIVQTARSPETLKIVVIEGKQTHSFVLLPMDQFMSQWMFARIGAILIFETGLQKYSKGRNRSGHLITRYIEWKVDNECVLVNV